MLSSGRSRKASASAQHHREALQLQTQADWAGREYVDLMSGSIKRIADFLNAFHLSCSSRLAELNSRLSVMERKIQYLESKVEMKATHNVDLTVGGDRVVIGAPINLQENKATNNIDQTEPITYNDGDDSPTRDDVSYTEDISESLAC
jgi:uncharacterized protein